MRSMKKMVAIVTVAGLIGVAGIAYAADIKSPADIAAALTGKSVSDVNQQRLNGKTYGSIAKDAGKLEEFKAQMLEQKKAVLDQQVKDGKITQQHADEIYNVMKNNQSTCDGTGSGNMGRRFGGVFGNGQGCGSRQGMGRGVSY